MKLKNGIDKFQEDYDKKWSAMFAGKRVGVVTSVSGVSSTGESTVTILRKYVNVTAIFGPEHGFRGERPAGENVASYTDEKTGLPVYSLYEGERKSISREMADEIDLIVYDIQDVGSRYYTYISTLAGLMEACSRYEIPLVVLDRPNPLGGTLVEGNLPDDKCRNFVCIHTITNRHGMTSGELAEMFREERCPDCQLYVIPCEGWQRSQSQKVYRGLWVPPSPNIPDAETALVYAGTCLIEGTNLSEGRGTASPFRMIGAPFLDADDLALELNGRKQKGVVFTPAFFTPVCSKYQGELCKGVYIHVTDWETFRPVTSALHILDAVRKLSGSQFEITDFMTSLWGNTELCAPSFDIEQIMEKMLYQENAFLQRRESFLIY